MKPILQSILLLAGLIAALNPGFAAATDRFYVGFNTGALSRTISLQGFEQFGATRPFFLPGSKATESFNNVRIGAALSETLACEFGYYRFSHADVDIPPYYPSGAQPLVAPREMFRYKEDGFSLDAVGRFSVGKRLKAYGLAGAVYDRTRVSELIPLYVGQPDIKSHAIKAHFGAGLEMKINGRLTLRAGYDVYKLASFANEGHGLHIGLNCRL